MTQKEASKLEGLIREKGLHRFLVESMSDILWVTGADFQPVYVSPSVHTMLGYAPDEIFTIDSASLITPESAKVIDEAYQKWMAMESGGSTQKLNKFSIDLEYVRKDGSKVWLETVLKAIRDEKGNLAGFNGVSRDISERKAAEEKKKETEAKFMLLLQHSDDIVFVHELLPDRPGKFINVNDKAIGVFGYTREEFKNMQIPDIEDPDFKPFYKHRVDSMFKNGYTSFETIHVAKNGEKILTEVNTRLFILDDKPAAISIIKNISEKKAAEERLKDSEARFRLIVDNAPEALYVQTEGKFAFVNQQTLELFGASSPNELIGKPLIERIHPDYRDMLKGRIDAINLLKKRVPLAEYVVLRLDGTPVDIAASAVPIKYEGKDGGIVFSRDISSRKAMEKEQRGKTELLEAILQNIPIMITYPDGKGGFNWVNRTWENTYGWKLDELRSMDVLAAQMPEQSYKQTAINFMNHKESTGIWKDFSNRRKDGSLIDTTWTNITLSDGFQIGIGMDITERNRITHDLGVSLQKLEKANMGIIQAISKIIDIRDPYTAGHQNRVAEVSRAIAMKMGLAPDTIEGIYLAAKIHDIGKVAIPSEILSKPGKLTEIDYLMIRTHPQAGYEILKDVEFPWDLSHMVLQHHERLDGSGYPNRLRGDEIMFEAKILAVADSIEAMATHRPYRAALGNEIALQQLSDLAGVEYDPEVVKACIALFKEDGFKFD